jgi:hypothetical protein
LGDLVGNLRDPLADDVAKPGLGERLEVDIRQHAGVGDDGDLRQLVGGHERLQHRQHGAGLGLVALERVHHQREPARVGEQADGDLWFQASLLAEPGFAEPVTLVGLEVQGADVVEHQRRRPQADVLGTRRRQPLAPLVGGVHRQPPGDRAIGRGGHAHLVDDPYRVGLAGRLD